MEVNHLFTLVYKSTKHPLTIINEKVNTGLLCLIDLFEFFFLNPLGMWSFLLHTVHIYDYFRGVYLGMDMVGVYRRYVIAWYVFDSNFFSL